MPDTPDVCQRKNYASHGWSSCFGGYAGITYPSARPYGLVLTSPDSTGIFEPFIDGVKFEVNLFNTLINTVYTCDTKFNQSSTFMTVTIEYSEGVQNRLILVYIADLGIPVYLFIQFEPMVWPNMRKPVTFPGPGVTPLPILAQVGPEVTLTPFNKRGYLMLD